MIKAPCALSSKKNLGTFLTLALGAGAFGGHDAKAFNIA
jgi:hypothetical protein